MAEPSDETRTLSGVPSSVPIENRHDSKQAGRGAQCISSARMSQPRAYSPMDAPSIARTRAHSRSCVYVFL
eukprot:6174936-Pleurochrysis_carterae.AAC.1